MKINLHKNARTTPAQRAFIQDNTHMNITDLAMRIGVSETTVRRWKNRDFVFDKSHTPRHIKTALQPADELAAVLFRSALLLSLDDLLQVMRRFISPRCSRSGLNRCLVRYGVSRLAAVQKEVPFGLKDYRGTYFYYSKIDLPAPVGWREPVSIHGLMDYTFRYLFVDIGDYSPVPDTGFLDRVIAEYPFTVFGVLFADPIVFEDSGTGPGNPGRYHGSVVSAWCRGRGLASGYLNFPGPSARQQLNRAWQVAGEPGRAALRSKLFNGDWTRVPWLQPYNRELALRALRRKTPYQALRSHYTLFPGSFKGKPERLIA
ncbi:MAG: helix-turn-helix domain-containing protein [Desulfobacter sp.]|nr:MAG: helix-turn-helix domain-containing protein [Desulfobacter sp.]